MSTIAIVALILQRPTKNPPVVLFQLTFLRVAKRGKAQGPAVGSSQEPGTIRIGWPVGRVAQAGWEAGGVIHDHYDGAERTGAANSQPHACDPPTGTRRG
jgi:hypothetical protein